MKVVAREREKERESSSDQCDVISRRLHYSIQVKNAGSLMFCVLCLVMIMVGSEALLAF